MNQDENQKYILRGNYIRHDDKSNYGFHKFFDMKRLLDDKFDV